MCLSVLKDLDEAWDAAQDSFVRLYERLPDYREEAPLRVFVSRISVHVAIDHRRKKLRRPELPLEPRALSRGADPGMRPDDALERRELGIRLERALAQLGQRQRSILSLREVEGLSYAQIARALGIPIGTVMSRLFYARRALRALLAPADDALATGG